MALQDARPEELDVQSILAMADGVLTHAARIRDEASPENERRFGGLRIAASISGGAGPGASAAVQPPERMMP